MLVYRSFVVGLLGTIALLIASLPGEMAARREAPPAPTVIHVSNSALAASPRPAETVADLITQVAGERVIVVIDP
jgi:hypothetical protein